MTGETAKPLAAAMPGRSFSGVIVPLLTPLEDDGRPDEAGLRRLVDYLLSARVHGLFAMGTTGEFQFLGHQAQLGVIATICDQAAGRAPVLAGVTGRSVEETVYRLAALEKLSRPPDAAVVAPLVYHSNRKLPRHLEQLAAVSRFPLYLYNNIGIVRRRWRRKDIIPELAGRAAGTPGYAGFKDSSGDQAYFREIIARCARPGFPVFQGVEKMMAESLGAGAAGVIAGTANAYPAFLVSLYEAARRGDREETLRRQQALSALADLYDPPTLIPALMKAYLRRRGVIACARTFVPPPADLAQRLAAFTRREKYFLESS